MDGRQPPGGVERERQQRAGAGRLEQGHHAVDDVLVDQLGVAEVDDRGLGEAADDLVRRGDHQVRAGLERALRQLGREAKVRAPRLVDDQRHAAPVRDLGRAPRRRRRRRSRWARRRSRRPRRASRRARPRARPAVTQWATPSSGSSSGATNVGSRPARIGAVDRRSSGRCAARRCCRPAWRRARQAAWFPCEAPLSEEPAAPRAPGLGGELLRELETGSAPGRRRSPGSARGCPSRARCAPTPSTSAGSAPRPPLCPGT